ncbi:MAG: HAD-IA family hydrolase [Clostridiales bacterium]|nr:HAD-IA family hydrolase [Clostridiales bacterium]
MIRAVIFDVGGTLHTSRVSKAMQQDFSSQVIKTLASAGIVLDVPPEEFYGPLYERAEEYKAWSEKTRRELPGVQVWKEYFLRPYEPDEIKLAKVSEELSYLYDSCRVELTPRPYMKETLKQLRDEGLAVGIISNILSLTFVPKILATYSIDGMMSCVVTSSETGIRKPDASIFRIAEEKLGMKPQELAYVGDTISRDVMGTKNAGWRLMIQIENPSVTFRDREVINKGYEPDYLISSLKEIPDIIYKENKAQA